MARQLTDKQLVHRQYLESPVWKDKRQQALEHYGCICGRCKNHGTDVHHKTYERVGGGELMEDLEVLCRPCHEAHHRIERANRISKPDKDKRTNRMAIAKYLTRAQKAILVTEYHLDNNNDLFYKITKSGSDELVLRAAKMLGFTDYYGSPRRPLSTKSHWRQPKEPSIDDGPWLSFSEFKALPNPLSASSSSS